MGKIAHAGKIDNQFCATCKYESCKFYHAPDYGFSSKYVQEHLKQIEMIAGDKKPIKWLATQKIKLVASFTLLPQNKKVENLANVFH